MPICRRALSDLSRQRTELASASSSFRTFSPVLFRKKQSSRSCTGACDQRTLSSFLNTCPKLERHALQGVIMKNKTNGGLTHPGGNAGGIQRAVLVAIAFFLASIPAGAQTAAENHTEVPENAPIK